MDVENDVELNDFAFVGDDIETEEIRDPDNPDDVEFDDILPNDGDDEVDDFYADEHFQPIDQAQFELMSRNKRPDFRFQEKVLKSIFDKTYVTTIMELQFIFFPGRI